MTTPFDTYLSKLALSTSPLKATGSTVGKIPPKGIPPIGKSHSEVEAAANKSNPFILALKKKISGTPKQASMAEFLFPSLVDGMKSFGAKLKDPSITENIFSALPSELRDSVVDAGVNARVNSWRTPDQQFSPAIKNAVSELQGNSFAKEFASKDVKAAADASAGLDTAFNVYNWAKDLPSNVTHPGLRRLMVGVDKTMPWIGTTSNKWLDDTLSKPARAGEAALGAKLNDSKSAIDTASSLESLFPLYFNLKDMGGKMIGDIWKNLPDFVEKAQGGTTQVAHLPGLDNYFTRKQKGFALI